MFNFFDKLFHKQNTDITKIENPRLLKAMHEIALRDTPQNRRRLYSELLKATFILPTPEPLKPGVHVADGKTTIQLIGINDKSGMPVTPAFTDDEALRNWDPNTPNLGLNARAYFQMIVALPFQEVVINPYDPIRKMIRPGGRVTRREFEFLANGVLPEPGAVLKTVLPPAGTKLRFSKAPAFPDAAMQKLIDLLVTLPEINSAFLLTVAYGDEQPHRAIAIRTDQKLNEQRQRTIAKSILEIVQPLLAQREPFDLIPLSGSFYDDVVHTTKPFYVRDAN